MDHLQTDIDSLETEKGQLKEKLKSIGKKTISVSGSDSMTGSTSITSTLDNKYYMQEINALKQALNNEHQQKKKIMCAILRQKLDSLEPLPSLTKLKSLDTKIQELRKKTTDLVKVIVDDHHYQLLLLLLNLNILLYEYIYSSLRMSKRLWYIRLFLI